MLIVFSLALLAVVGVVFTRTIASRVPQQRATLEKLIAERTGLEVRFDNVHFAWNLDGTSAVFTRVELTDPKANRVRVTAPELRVKFDTWDFLRHDQFSFGHVTLASPEIEITADAEAPDAGRATPVDKRARTAAAAAPAPADEAALMRRYTSWMEAMPTGRIEVEGARVHLKRRGDPRPQHTFTLSQATISRGTSNFNAWGTLLLAQDVGQSLFVSAKFEGLAPGSAPTGDLRLIARRIFLDKLSHVGLDGRGTLDARLHVRDGLIDNGSWQASARDIAFEDGPRFDHAVVNGRLSRDASEVVLDFDDLQMTRGARLERAPSATVRFALDPAALRVVRTTLHAERVPFMAGELLAALTAPRMAPVADLAGDWEPTAGELLDVSFDTGAGGANWTFSTRIAGGELTRADPAQTGYARLSQLSATVRADARAVAIAFDSPTPASLQLADAAPRDVRFAGTLAFDARSPRRVTFTDLAAESGASRIAAGGEWNAGARLLDVRVTDIDRALAGELWQLFAEAEPAPEILARIAEGRVSGTLALAPADDAAGIAVDWPRSRGKLEVDALATHDEPRLTAARGALEFARGAAQLKLDSGRVEDLTLTGARLEWPRQGAPRLRAALDGTFDSPLLRRALAGEGLDRLHGGVSLEAEARGEQELRAPERWRFTARVAGASLALADDIPAIDGIGGTVRYAEGVLRAVDLDGQWLGGAVRLEGRRANARAPLNVSLSGVADAQPLLRALGQQEVAGRVSGELAWNGTARRAAETSDNDAWRVTLASNLVGLESRLAEPFAKSRARALPLEAELRVDRTGILDFSIEGRDLAVRGEVRDDVVGARYALLGVTGELRRPLDPRAAAQVRVDRIDLSRAPAVFAAAHTLLPDDGSALLSVGDLRVGAGKSDPGLGALHASLARTADGVRFDLQSDDGSVHRLAARGQCHEDRCRADFTLDTPQLATLVRGMRLPPEWPTQALQARGELSWSAAGVDVTRSLAGAFEIDAQGETGSHQLFASATLADGDITIASLQGAGPEPTQMFRGKGRLGLLARDYDLSLEYERVSALAANTVPTPTRARLARAWSVLRGSAARRGWGEAPEVRRVQWHGYWE